MPGTGRADKVTGVDRRRFHSRQAGRTPEAWQGSNSMLLRTALVGQEGEDCIGGLDFVRTSLHEAVLVLANNTGSQHQRVKMVPTFLVIRVNDYGFLYKILRKL